MLTKFKVFLWYIINLGVFSILTWVLFDFGFIYGDLSGLIWLMLSEFFIFTLIFLTFLVYKVKNEKGKEKEEIAEEKRDNLGIVNHKRIPITH